jgi:predicted molibdopterin-dependent oxidoreductase YjgC
MAEIAELTPHFAGVTYERLGRRGLQWPVAPDGTDTPTCFTERFEHPNGRARLAPLAYQPPGSEPTPDFPLVLVTGRRLEHYNVGTMTRRTRNLALRTHESVDLNPADGGRLGIADGDLVEVRSAHGATHVLASLTSRIEQGQAFMSFHYPDAHTNVLLGASADLDTGCPEYKVVPVAVRLLERGELLGSVDVDEERRIDLEHRHVEVVDGAMDGKPPAFERR